MCFHDISIKIQDGGNTGVADRMSADLQPGSIGLYITVTHERNGMHFIRQQPAIISLIKKWFIKVRSTGAERAVSKRLDRANAQIRPTESLANTQLHLIVNLGNKRGSVNSGGELACSQQLSIDGNVFVISDHVLHASDPNRRRVRERSLNYFDPLIMRERRDHLIYVVRGRVFQSAGGISVRVAHDCAPRRIGGL